MKYVEYEAGGKLSQILYCTKALLRETADVFESPGCSLKLQLKVATSSCSEWAALFHTLIQLLIAFK